MSEIHHYEALVLGACMQSPELVPQVALQAQDFCGDYHAEAWAAIVNLQSSGQACDIVGVTNSCRLPLYVAVEMVRNCYSTSPELVLSWSRIIRDRSRRDRLAIGLRSIADAGHEADVLLHQARELIIGIESDGPSKEKTNRDILAERLDALDDRISGKVSPIGLSFGVKDFDKLSYGMKPSELLVLAARPAMGKSAFALQAARVSAEAGKRVLFFSLEMDVGELFDRMICQHSRFPADHYAEPAKSDRDFSELASAVKTLQEVDITCYDSIFDIEGITSKCRAMHNIKPVDLIVVDYLQLIGTKGRANQNRSIEVGDYSRSLKMLAMQLGCPVLLLSQLNRNVETRPDKRPLMADLRESGSVEQDANKVIMIYRDEVYNEDSQDKGVAEIILRKHRNGMTGVVPCASRLRWFEFADLARDWDAPAQAVRNDPFA